MKVKKMITLMIITILVLGTIIVFISYFSKEEITFEEYVPQEEISVEQERKTLVPLYFQSKETKELVPEARMVDVKLLLETPYTTLLNLLLEGPKNESLEKVIPNEMILDKAERKENTAIIKLSMGQGNLSEDVKNKVKESIQKTFTSLTEIDHVEIIIQEGKSE